MYTLVQFGDYGAFKSRRILTWLLPGLLRASAAETVYLAPVDCCDVVVRRPPTID